MKGSHSMVTFNDEVFYVISNNALNSLDIGCKSTISISQRFSEFQARPDRDGGRNVRSFKQRGWSMNDLRGSLRRFLWFTVISAFAYGGGMADHSGLRSYNSTTERKRRKRKRKEGASRWAEISRGSVCASRHIRSHLWPPRPMSFFLPLARHLSSVLIAVPFRRSS